MIERLKQSEILMNVIKCIFLYHIGRNRLLCRKRTNAKYNGSNYQTRSKILVFKSKKPFEHTKVECSANY
jgi:hypothetical protein